jgi:hypothetical protein
LVFKEIDALRKVLQKFYSSWTILYGKRVHVQLLPVEHNETEGASSKVKRKRRLRGHQFILNIQNGYE